MLKNLNFNTDVTTMVEMYKVYGTEMEDVTPTKEVTYTMKETTSISQNVQYPVTLLDDAARTGMTENNMISHFTDFDIIPNIKKSNDLKDVIRHDFKAIHFENGDQLLSNTKHRIDKTKEHTKKNVKVYVDMANGYSVVLIENRQGTSEIELHLLEFTNEAIEIVLRNILRKMMYRSVPDNTISEKLRALWLHQIKDELNEVKEKRSEKSLKNKHLREIVNSLANDIVENKNKNVMNVSYNDLFKFFEEIKNQKLTQETKSVQEWISYDNLETAIDSYMTHEYFEKLEKTLKVDVEESDKIAKQLLRSSHFKNKWYVEKVFKVNDKKHTKHEVYTGIHGTNNSSVLSILLNGFQNVKQLRKNNINHNYTGSGLGSGTYFAHLHQASKSSNYTGGSSDTKYMVVADVEYRKDNVLKVKGYDSSINAQNYDLVHGIKVGSYDIDEVVAPHSEKINVRYLVKMTRKG